MCEKRCCSDMLDSFSFKRAGKVCYSPVLDRPVFGDNGPSEGALLQLSHLTIADSEGTVRAALSAIPPPPTPKTPGPTPGPHSIVERI